MTLRLQTVLLAPFLILPSLATANDVVHLGPRPLHLVDRMTDGPLKSQLQACAAGPFARTDFSIGHRGAPLQFPEHTRESYTAAARMGAGILECDVTFTADKQLVCRHSQSDLHTTTNILMTALASKCTKPFTPAAGDERAGAECRTSDITLDEYRTLSGKMDSADRTATTVEAYVNSTPSWRTDLYAGEPTALMTHAESIELFKSLGVKFSPELKAPVVDMPYGGMSQEGYAQQLIDEYKAAGIAPADVWPQSFNLDDVLYWIENEPEFGKQAIYLDGSFSIDGWDPMRPDSWTRSMAELKAMGVNYIAPPLWVLVTLKDGKIVPSVYAEEAKAAGLRIVSWTVERSGPLTGGGGWYYKSIKDAVTNDGAVYELLHVLDKQVGVEAVFSDWPATVTYYANCLRPD